MPGVNAILRVGHRWRLHATRCTGALMFQTPYRKQTCFVGWLSVVLVCASVALFIFRIAGAEQALVWSPRRANERYPDRWGNQEVQLFQLSNSSCQQAFSAFIPRARTLTNVLWLQAFRGWIRELHRMRASKISPWLAGVLNLYVIAVIPIEYGSDCRVRSSGVDVDYRSQRNETQGPEPLSWRIWDWSIVQLSSCNATLLHCYTATLNESVPKSHFSWHSKPWAQGFTICSWMSKINPAQRSHL